MTHQIMGFTMHLFFSSLVACGPKAAPPANQSTSGDADRAPSTEDGPTGMGLFANHLTAVGGEDALRAHSTVRMEGRYRLPAQGIEATILVLGAAPAVYYTLVEIPGLGTFEDALTPEGLGWTKDPMVGPALKSGEELADAQWRAHFYQDADYQEVFTSFGAPSATQWAGQDAWNVEVTTTHGQTQKHLFAKDTGLKIGQSMVVTTTMGDIQANLEFGDYKTVQGQLVPTSIIDRKGPIVTEMIYDHIVYDDPEWQMPSVPDDVAALQQMPQQE